MSVERAQGPRAAAQSARAGSARALLRWREAQDAPIAPWVGADRYAVMVGEVMAQQTQLSRAVARWEQWMQQWPTTAALAVARLTDVLALWQGLGYPRRARALHESARVVTVHGWPDDLTILPGIGAYTAAAIAVFAEGKPVLPRDVNVERVLARRWPQGLAVHDYARTTTALMHFGQQICQRTPRCAQCPLRRGCPVGEGNSPDPVIAPRAQAAYEGSLRQRRGRLLAEALASPVALGSADADAARTLLADGLLVEEDGLLRTP